MYFPPPSEVCPGRENWNSPGSYSCLQAKQAEWKPASVRSEMLLGWYASKWRWCDEIWKWYLQSWRSTQHPILLKWRQCKSTRITGWQFTHETGSQEIILLTSPYESAPIWTNAASASHLPFTACSHQRARYHPSSRMLPHRAESSKSSSLSGISGVHGRGGRRGIWHLRQAFDISLYAISNNFHTATMFWL